MTGTLRNAPCRKGKQFTQATSEEDQGGYLEFERVNGSNFLRSSARRWTTLETTPRPPYTAVPKRLLLIKRFQQTQFQHRRQLNSQNCSWKKPQRSRLFLCNQLPKAFQRSVTLLGTDTPLDTWLILLLSDFLGY